MVNTTKLSKTGRGGVMGKEKPDGRGVTIGLCYWRKHSYPCKAQHKPKEAGGPMAPVIRSLLCEVCRPLVVCVLLNKHGHEGQHPDDYKEC